MTWQFLTLPYLFVFNVGFSQFFPSFVNDRSLRSITLLLAYKLCVLLVLFIVFAFLNDKHFLAITMRVIVTFNLLERIYNIFRELLFINAGCLPRLKLKKCFKISNVKSEAVTRMTDRTMNTWKRTKKQSTTQKTTMEQHEPL
jgi:putative Ca2+/H+ antiporter (TMEM165/GDT1 family)